MIPNSTTTAVTANELLEAQSSVETPGSRFRFLPPTLALSLMTALASCTSTPGYQMPPAGYRLTPAQAAAAAIQAPRGPAYSLDHGPAQTNHGSLNNRIQKPASGPIHTLAHAKSVAYHLENLYIQCNQSRTVLNTQDLIESQSYFREVTEFGNTYGQGESPTRVHWSTIRDWLGMGKWETDFINEQTRKNQAKYAGHAQASHHRPNNTVPNQTANHYAGLYGSVTEANQPMPHYANLQPKTFRQHVVQPGETFSGISKLYGVDRRVVWDWNSKNIANPHQIRPRMVVWIPVY